jgi:hypothetical protein
LGKNFLQGSTGKKGNGLKENGEFEESLPKDPIFVFVANPSREFQ